MFLPSEPLNCGLSCISNRFLARKISGRSKKVPGKRCQHQGKSKNVWHSRRPVHEGHASGLGQNYHTFGIQVYRVSPVWSKMRAPTTVTTTVSTARPFVHRSPTRRMALRRRWRSWYWWTLWTEVSLSVAFFGAALSLITKRMASPFRWAQCDPIRPLLVRHLNCGTFSTRALHRADGYCLRLRRLANYWGSASIIAKFSSSRSA